MIEITEEYWRQFFNLDLMSRKLFLWEVCSSSLVLG